MFAPYLSEETTPADPGTPPPNYLVWAAAELAAMYPDEVLEEEPSSITVTLPPYPYTDGWDDTPSTTHGLNYPPQEHTNLFEVVFGNAHAPYGVVDGVGQAVAPQTSQQGQQTDPGLVGVSPKKPRKAKTGKDDQYYCTICEKHVPLRKRNYHERKHNPESWVYACRICEVLELQTRPLSRRDALKRHVQRKHRNYAGLLETKTLKLLEPRARHEFEDMYALRVAMTTAHTPEG